MTPENKNDSSYVIYGKRTKLIGFPEFIVIMSFLGLAILFGVLVLMAVSLCEFWLS